MNPNQAPPNTARTRGRGLWWRVMLAAVALFAAIVAVTYTTQNPNLVPTMIFVGSFLVPSVVVIYVAEQARGSLSRDRLIVAFLLGGTVGMLGASLLEAPLTSAWDSYILVALIEESVKGILIIILGWSVQPRNARQGAVLGATIGAGFAAFESAGYAYNASIGHAGGDLLAVLDTELIRAVLAPVGHVIWSATIGAIIFEAVHHPKRRPSVGVTAALTFLTVCALHALWDSMSWLAAAAASAITRRSSTDLAYGQLLRFDKHAAALLSACLYVAGLALVASLGCLLLSRWLPDGNENLHAQSPSNRSADHEAAAGRS